MGAKGDAMRSEGGDGYSGVRGLGKVLGGIRKVGSDKVGGPSLRRHDLRHTFAQ